LPVTQLHFLFYFVECGDLLALPFADAEHLWAFVAVTAMCDFAEVADELECKFLIFAARSGGYKPAPLRHVPAR
jgi:hypothetical protein